MALQPGKRLGPYEIVAPLGAGGMGEVYRGRDTRLERDVAIKVLSQHLANNPQFKQRFEREARAIVFDSPTIYDSLTTVSEVRDPGWYSKTGMPTGNDGVVPFFRYVIRQNGKVELANFACAGCHT